MRASYIGIAALAIVVTGNAVRTMADELPPIPPIKRVLPPPGIEIPEPQRAKLRAAIDELAGRIEQATGALKKGTRYLLPDVEIYHKAVSYALDNDEFYELRDIDRAAELLKAGHMRLDELLAGNPSWLRQTGTVVRGFRSRIDGSLQPYGMVIPASFQPGNAKFYVWLHGRGDKSLEPKFLLDRQSKPGEIVPADAIVVHAFGRHCNAFKFAGETDVFEALNAANHGDYFSQRPRSVLCGFSMGGAGAWHLGAHYPDRWYAVSPGAGFAETARYQNITPDKRPPWYEQTLWGLYDAPNYVCNLFNLPVVAYSGELDKQIQAARIMEEAFAKEGRTLDHLIGPGMGHKYHPDTLKKLHGLLANYAADPQPLRQPKEVHLQTRTLRYNRAGWVRILMLDRHWEDTRVDAKILSSGEIAEVTTKNVAMLQLALKPGQILRSIDGQQVAWPPAVSSWILHKIDGRWESLGEQMPKDWNLRKLPRLQGPIDDAFMEPFLVVTPSGVSSNPLVQRWGEFELAHFKDRWRRIFRGDVREKKDTDVTEDDLQQYHVIAWGDPTSNKLLAKVAGKLPFPWTEKELKVGDQTYSSAGHVPVMIYPNPLSPSKYLVINSGPTFREGHDSSNSLQTPKLPDWAVIDLSQLPDARAAGRVADAGFFDEQWQFTKERPALAP